MAKEVPLESLGCLGSLICLESLESLRSLECLGSLESLDILDSLESLDSLVTMDPPGKTVNQEHQYDQHYHHNHKSVDTFRIAVITSCI
ncbi:hypothetical protein QZH41_012032 [Actinostola sp. cb2023]|nr:hypothetical protein QZH41_012032 [Actinostola sp. cb2023]